MRAFAISVLLCTSTASALADAPRVPAIDVRTLPAQCRVVAAVPPSARVPGPAFDAAISAANCMAIVKFRTVKMTPTPGCVQALDQAIRPSVQILDAVIQSADPERKIVALHAKGDLLSGAAVNLLSSIPPYPAGSTGDVLAAHDALINAANDAVQPWRDRARITFSQVADLANQNPQLVASNPVVAYDVRDSAVGARATVATR